ncbi:hypothetical protein ACHAXT_007243 [Thalassiosira profunda]
MIEYYRGPYGANLLFRWHGSALAKAFLPGLLSVAIYLILFYAAPAAAREDEYLNHPYAVGVLVSSVSFLIIFRANYGYQRYWEACGAVHKLTSKWMDATAFCGVFHLQSELYGGMRPPSFFDHDDLNQLHLTRDREGEASYKHGAPGAGLEGPSNRSPGGGPQDEAAEGGARRATVESLRSHDSDENVSRSLRRRRYVKSINETRDTRGYSRTESDAAAELCDEKHLLGPPRLDGGWGLLYPNEINGKCTATYCDISEAGKQRRPMPDGRGFASTVGGRTPSLFLQELAHLSSLLCAVALTTLRNDLDYVESPLDVYIPGQPWPVVDPVKLPKETKRRAYQHRRFRRNLRYLLGMDQTKKSRTIYNAARPMLVLGGVSDNEIAFLQRARGPYAKTQLVWGWLSDFIIREHLAGSLGKVGPPIVSRIVQFLSDGILHYNHARKIMFTPFPFPHAQLSAFFVLTMVLAIPFLMDQYANEPWLGATLSFLTVTCLSGLHEVARELENPFRNAPNDVPLCTLLAFYNEALVTMFAGHHPDAYWEGADVLRKKGKEKKVLTSAADAGEVGENGTKDDDDGSPPLIPELPEEERNGQRRPATASSAPPQSTVDDSQLSLKELREMVDSQASKIRELQERVGRGRPMTAPS